MASRKTLRLTVGQAVAKYLSVQYSEMDGKKQRLIPGMAPEQAGTPLSA